MSTLPTRYPADKIPKIGGYGGVATGGIDLYSGIRSKNPVKAGAGALQMVAPITGPLALPLTIAATALSFGAGFLMKKPSNNKERTQLVKNNMRNMTRQLRSKDYDGAFQSFQQVLGNTLKSKSFRAALLATNPDAWGQIGFMKEQADKLNAGDLEGDPAGQLINSMSDFMLQTKDAEKVNPFIEQMRKAVGGMFNYITGEIQYTPYGRESYEQVKGELPQMIGGTGPESQDKTVQDVLAWKPQYARGEFSPQESARGPGGYYRGEFSPPATSIRGDPAPFEVPPPKKPYVPLTQQEYYDKSLGLGNYRGTTPRYPAGRQPPPPAEQPPLPPAGIQVPPLNPQGMGAPPLPGAQVTSVPPQTGENQNFQPPMGITVNRQGEGGQMPTTPLPPIQPPPKQRTPLQQNFEDFLNQQGVVPQPVLSLLRPELQQPKPAVPPSPPQPPRRGVPPRRISKPPGGEPPPVKAYDPLTRLQRNLREIPLYK